VKANITTQQSRFSKVSRGRAIAVIISLLGLVAFTLSPFFTSGRELAQTPAAEIATGKIEPHGDDLALYRAIVKDTAQKGYYQAAATELRKGNYPLKPFVAFRLPTLATISAFLGLAMMQAMLWILVAATVFAWWQRLEGAFDPPQRRHSAAMLVAAGCILAFQPQYVVLHELWAGLLMALSFALHRTNRWWPAVVTGALALSIRELALPYTLLMAAIALAGRNWREVAAWICVVAAFAIALVFHVEAVNAVVTANDPASPGWSNLGGWQSFIRASWLTGPLRVFPFPVGATIVVLSLFGWWSWNSRTGLIASLLISGYALFLMLFGRPENFYWGLMITPAYLVGLAFLPKALADLSTAISAR
jgi:hypothetical protein